MLETRILFEDIGDEDIITISDEELVGENVVHFYRYETPLLRPYGNNEKLDLRVFRSIKETPKGHWIVPEVNYSVYTELEIKKKRWVSNNSRKRFAYPTKEEALLNFQYRKRSELGHLQARMERVQEALNIANKKSDVEIIPYHELNKSIKIDTPILNKWKEKRAFIKEDEMNL